MLIIETAEVSGMTLGKNVSLKNKTIIYDTGNGEFYV